MGPMEYDHKWLAEPNGNRYGIIHLGHANKYMITHLSRVNEYGYLFKQGIRILGMLIIEIDTGLPI